MKQPPPGMSKAKPPVKQPPPGHEVPGSESSTAFQPDRGRRSRTAVQRMPGTDEVHLKGTDAYLNRVIGCLESIHQHPTDGIFWRVVVGKAMLGTEQDEAFAVSPVNLQMVARQIRPEVLAKYVEEGRSDPGKDGWFLRVLDYYRGDR